MKTLYVRIGQKNGQETFFRCAMQFSRVWRKVEVDQATAARLEAEQMLEVSETKPEDYEDESAGDSATPSVSGNDSGTPAVAPVAVPAVPPTAPVLATDNPAPGTEAPSKPNDPVELSLAIRDAVAKLDKENVELWTAAGKPTIPAIATVTGWPVTAAERDAALVEPEAA